MLDNIPKDMMQATAEYRDKIELLRSRVNLLTGKDKLLMTMYLDNSNSFRQMSRLAGMSDTTIARRVNGIIKRLADEKYVSCLRNRDKFSSSEMSIAKEHFLLGLSARKIAARRRWSYYRARRTIKKIRMAIGNQ
jgi:alkylated DNA nucleotide flippase Atl1